MLLRLAGRRPPLPRAVAAAARAALSTDAGRPPFDKILIANRGEIACRVMRTSRRLGVKTVAVYSEADAGAVHVRSADEAYCIGPAAATESYLRADAIIDACRRSGAQAVHPGYGFLSENAGFAEALAQAGITFIGPPVPAIEAMGSKSASKDIMGAAGVPLTPGYHGDEQDADFLMAKAEEVGYPLLIKAVMGGGGKGMRVVTEPSEFKAALESCQRESLKSFGDDRVLLERFLVEPRHVEVQVFGDKLGNCVYLHERDCSVQRRHQKVLEEAPGPGLSQEQRTYVGEAAVKAAQAVDYVGAGTVEFLQDGQTGEFFFCEMNTRLQVEHPVTEEITGVDLVEWQLKVAAGQALPIASQEDIPPPNGHAIEARVYAENPNRGFLPSTGTLLRHREPSSREGVRVDTGVREGGEVTMYYDPMISKLIVWGEDRAAALRRLDDALANYEIAGVQSNLQFLKLTAGHPAFVAGGVSTGFLDEHGPGLLDKLRKPAPLDVRALAAFAVLAKEDGRVAGSGDLWQKTGFRSYGQAAAGIHLVDADAVDGGTEPEHAQEPIRVVRERNGAYRFSGAGFFGEQGEGQDIVVNGSLNEDGDLIADVNGRQYHCRAVVTIHSTDVREGAEVILSIAGGAAEGTEDGNGCRSSWRFTVPVEEYKAASSLGGGAATISAPMPGKVIAIKVGEGDSVSAGDPVVVLEAMKMEQVLAAPANAVVGSIFCSEGEQVADGTTLVALAAGEEEEASGGAGGAVAA